MQLMWCIGGQHPINRWRFTREVSGIESKQMCNVCYAAGIANREKEDSNEDDLPYSPLPDTPIRRGSNPDVRRGSLASIGSDFGNLDFSQTSRDASPSDPRQPRRRRSAPQLDATDSILNFDQSLNNSNAPALSEKDWKSVLDFNARLAKESELHHCYRCKET